MIACTSISPKHANNDIQKIATDSWIANGIKVYSFNCPAEVEILSPLYPDVTFVPTHRTMEHHFGKPYVSINAVLDWCKDQAEDLYCLINSDIELASDLNLVSQIANGLTDTIYLCNRYNYSTDKGSGRIFRDGIDVFFVHKKFMDIYPQSVFCFGQCHWDYWIPYRALLSQINVQYIDTPFAFHKMHPVQYSYENWLKTGRFFRLDNGLYQFDDKTGVPAMSKYIFNILNTGIKRVKM